MKKADFLKEAQAKYKNANEKVTNGVDWVSEMNFIYSPQLILRVWFDHTADNHKGEFMHRWCTIDTLPCQSDDEAIKSLKEILSDGDEKSIIQFIREADEDTLNEPANGLQFHNGKGECVEITLWQPVEEWTLKQVAKHIGL